MGAVSLCEFSADASVRTMILDSVALMAIEGSGELLFAGRRWADMETDLELIAARVGSLERAQAVVRAWRLKPSIPPSVHLRLIKLEPARPFDDPLMLFP